MVKPLMFRAKLTISKVAPGRARPFGRAFLFVAYEFEKQHPRTKSAGVTEGFWQSAISKAVCLPGFFKGVMDE